MAAQSWSHRIQLLIGCFPSGEAVVPAGYIRRQNAIGGARSATVPVQVLALTIYQRELYSNVGCGSLYLAGIPLVSWVVRMSRMPTMSTVIVTSFKAPNV